MGVAAYSHTGERLWHVLAGSAVPSLQSAGGYAYAYVPGPGDAPLAVRVVDLRAGAVRTVPGAMPLFVSP